jgi:xylulokinase
MSGAILLAVDLGTTNCKAAAYSLDGSLRASESRPYPTLNPCEGWYEQRPDDWKHAITRAVSSVTGSLGKSAADVAGLCLSAWGPGLVLLGHDGEPLNDASPTWQDVRSLEHGRQLVEQAGPGWVGGGMPLTGFPAKLAWAIDAWPERAAAASYAVGVKDYLLFWLTGVLATEPSSGPYSARWPRHVFGAIGWDAARLPPVISSTAVLGVLREELAEELGLAPGLPVVAGINDGAAATLGVGACRAGDAVVSLGTNGVLRLLTATPPSAERCLACSLFRYPVVDDIWACGGFVLTGGSALAWVADATAAESGATEIDALLQAAAEVPVGSDGVLFLPYLIGKGSPDPDPDATAAFIGLRLRHRRAHLVRAVLEGVAFGVRDIVEELQAQGLDPERLFVTGGGAASPLWRSVFTGVLGMPATHATGDSTLGSAIVLAAGLDLARDIQHAVAQLGGAASTTETTAAAVDSYEGAYRAYRAAVSTTGAG